MTSSGLKSASPELPLASAAIDFSAAPVIVNVGSDESQRFYVNETVLRRSSKFFNAALGKEWKERQERTINLPEGSPAAFNTYLNWLTSGKLYVSNQPETERRQWSCDTRLLEAYLLGDKLSDVDYKDAAADALANEFHTLRGGWYWSFCKNDRTNLYENTVAGASLRLLFVQSMLTHCGVQMLETEGEPNALLHEMVMAMHTRGRPSKRQFEEDVKACEFHEHEPGAENCYKNKRSRES
ncbi:hypothetical protein CB0940_04707 [Cercospora beticola]|uniref:BTB domain-containing protein n=1 Tax=Cercospora beticola TaxID=122368 RepID=A0A2G5HJ99_CERBT|nr:hypothetical protein CB0940_04707 [Cercospora beticola]PIA92634.1 hypothetical protein CB0940_04707 [Cercospora beticola]WPB01969.1 hypothetical protein RHO25_006603 [Cercospora beticola]CAK1363182.1 unnamed protein product [Cercospora beticola]